jgi:predicted metal-dependent phosphoesterase TrpH
MLQIDLHSHSLVSDGSLTPAELVRHAAGQGIKVLALTDHDDTAGLAEARATAAESGIAFIAGTEISVTWNRHTVHIVGLKIDPDNPALQAGLEAIRVGRVGRAAEIAAALAKAGIQGSLEGAHAFASKRIIGRMHFAQFLAQQGYAKDVPSVFRKYLAKGKPGYVPHDWAALEDAVRWIREAGGLAVIAHPGRCDFGSTTLRALLGEFKELGGTGIEVVTGSHTAEQAHLFAGHARRYGLLASVGSDYHGPGYKYLEMGRLPPLPDGCTPIWQDWPEATALV